MVFSVAGNPSPPTKNSVVSSNDLYSSDPDGKARQGRMASAAAGGAIRPTPSLVYSTSLGMFDDEGRIEGIKLVESNDSSTQSGVFSYSSPISRGFNRSELSHLPTVHPTGDENEGSNTLEILTVSFITPERTMCTLAKSPPGTPLFVEAALSHDNANMNVNQDSHQGSQTSLSQTSVADNDSDGAASSSDEDVEESISSEEEEEAFLSDEEDCSDVSEEGLETQWHDEKEGVKSVYILAQGVNTPERMMLTVSKSAPRKPLLVEALMANDDSNMNVNQDCNKISQDSLSQTSLTEQVRDDTTVSASSIGEDVEECSDIPDEALETQWHEEKECEKTVEISARGSNSPEITILPIAKSPFEMPLLGESQLAHAHAEMNVNQDSPKISQADLSQSSLYGSDRDDSDVSASSSDESLEEDENSFSSDEENYDDASEEGLETQWYGGSPEKSIHQPLGRLVRSLSKKISKKSRKQISDEDSSDDRPSRSAKRWPIGLAERVRRSLGRSTSAGRTKNIEEEGAMATTPWKAPVPESALQPIPHTRSGIYGFTHKTRDTVSHSWDQ